MNWVQLLCVAAVIFVELVNAKSGNTGSSQNNEVEPTPLRIDPILRQALLRALSNIDTETTEETADRELQDPDPTANPDDATPLEDNTEVKEDLDESNPDERKISSIVKYHTFVVDGKLSNNVTEPKPAQANPSDSIVEMIVKTNPTEIPLPVSEDTVNINFEDPDPNDDSDEDSDSNVDTVEERSVASLIKTNEVAEERKAPAKTKETFVRKITTTTTPAPPRPPPPEHNEDGENIEKVEDQVQVFQAPLVAAFTVHQDAAGLPRSVVPIFKQPVLTQPLNKVQKSTISLQQTLEQKQRILEQQLYYLQQQQIQQERLLNQQKLYHEQQLAQRQQQYLQDQQRQQFRIEEEQRQRLQTFDQQQSVLQQESILRANQFQQQQKQLQQQQNQQRQQSNQQQQQQQFELQSIPSTSSSVTFQQGVQFQQQQKQLQQQQNQQHQQQNLQQQRQNQHQQPFELQSIPSTSSSVTFQQSVAIPTVTIPTEQQLPSREAVDFLADIRQRQPNPLPLQLREGQNYQSQQFDQVLSGQQLPPHRSFQTFFNNFQPVPAQSNRIFRQESSSGNFEFKPSQPELQPTRIYRDDKSTGNLGFNNFETQPRFRPDNQLQTLLFQSGFNQGRSQEDLNIVSKVLSLNHGLGQGLFGDNNNFLFGESRRYTNKVQIPDGFVFQRVQ